MTKTEKIVCAVQTVIESAIVLCASGLAAVAYFDELYIFFTACAAVAVFMQIVVCVRTQIRKAQDDIQEGEEGRNDEKTGDAL